MQRENYLCSLHHCPCQFYPHIRTFFPNLVCKNVCSRSRRPYRRRTAVEVIDVPGGFVPGTKDLEASPSEAGAGFWLVGPEPSRRRSRCRIWPTRYRVRWKMHLKRWSGCFYLLDGPCFSRRLTSSFRKNSLSRTTYDISVHHMHDIRKTRDTLKASYG
jgi:hypothetical protein